MPAARILADASGRLSVPDEPIIPVVPGDGAGVEAWRATRRVIDAALEKAYGTRRRLHYLEHAAGERGQRELNDRIPPATVNAFRLHRVGLNGGQRPLGTEGGPTLTTELRALLDLHVRLVVLTRPANTAPALPGWPAELAIAHDLGEGTGPMLELGAGSSRASMLLDKLAADLPQVLAPFRFATVAGVDAFAETRGDPPPGTVDAAVALQPASTEGTARLLRSASLLARRLGRSTVVFAQDALERPELAASRQMAAKFAWDALPSAERGTLEFRRAAALVGEAAGLGRSLVTAPEAEGRRLVQAFVPAFGGGRRAATGGLNVESGHAVFAPLSPDFEAPSVVALAAAARLLLVHLGWNEAATVLERAIPRVEEGAPAQAVASELVAAFA